MSETAPRAAPALTSAAAGMVHGGRAERVVPLARTSDNATVILGRPWAHPDLVHTDAAHEYDPVRRDIGNRRTSSPGSTGWR